MQQSLFYFRSDIIYAYVEDTDSELSETEASNKLGWVTYTSCAYLTSSLVLFCPFIDACRTSRPGLKHEKSSN